MSALDAQHRAEILALLGRLKRDQGLAMLFITHDPAAARALAERVAIMDRGASSKPATPRRFSTIRRSQRPAPCWVTCVTLCPATPARARPRLSNLAELLNNRCMATQPTTPLPHADTDSFVLALLGARDMASLATVTRRYLEGLGLTQVQLVWNHQPDDPRRLHTADDVPPDPALLAVLERARREGGVAEDREANGHRVAARVLAQNAGFWAALVCRTEHRLLTVEWAERLSPLAVRCQSLLHTQRLQVDVERLANAERLQRALFAISDIVSSGRSTDDVLHGLHQIVGRLMYAENFYIVRFDPQRETIRFLYFADSHDPDAPDPEQVLTTAEMGNSLTLAMLRHGQAIRGPSRQLREELHVPRDDALGPDSEDWLGVPIIEDAVVRGAVVVQSYDPAVRYTESDQALLSYVAQHILSALARREAQEELEHRVQERTVELRREIHERQRSEQLQPALYRIAELSGSSDSIESFYASVHEIVGELLDARNFYIALLTADGQHIDFPYSIDERDERKKIRPLAAASPNTCCAPASRC